MTVSREVKLERRRMQETYIEELDGTYMRFPFGAVFLGAVAWIILILLFTAGWANGGYR